MEAWHAAARPSPLIGGTTILRLLVARAGSNLLISLLSFNVGIEIGRLAVLCSFVLALALLFRGAMSGRMGIIVVSAIIAHIAWHWGRDLQPTDRALALLPPLENVLAEIGALLQPATPFDPETEELHTVILTADFRLPCAASTI